MKMNTMVKKALSDKNVLYVVLFISCAVLLGYLVNNDFESVIFFCVVGFLLSQFSKNMTVVLGGTVIATSLFKSMRVGREGFKEGVGHDDDDEEEEKDKKKDHKCHDLTDASGCNAHDGCTWHEDKCHESKDGDESDDSSGNGNGNGSGNGNGNGNENKDSMAVMEGNRGMRASQRASQRAAKNGASLDATQNEKTLKMAGKMIDRLEGMLSRVEKFGGMFGGGK